MTDFTREILEKWQVRKTAAQKTAFIERMQREFPALQVEGNRGCRNLVIGDVDSAQLVLTAHYDTCARMPLPNVVLPQSALLSLLYGFVLVIPILVLAVLSGFGVNLLALVLGMDESSALMIGNLAYLAMLFLLVALIYVGPANPHTVNDNTSGVITLIELLSTLTEEQRQKVAFVFFDKEELGLVGSTQFRKQHREAAMTMRLINFDCVSDGDTIALICARAVPEEEKDRLQAAFAAPEGKRVLVARRMFYPSDQRHFPLGIGVAALKGKKLLYLDRIHTKRDTVLDEANIRLLVSAIARLV